MWSKKKYQAYIKGYLKKKYFKFSLKIFHCFVLVISIFLVAFAWSKVNHYLENKFRLADSTEDLTSLINKNVDKKN